MDTLSLLKVWPLFGLRVITPSGFVLRLPDHYEIAQLAIAGSVGISQPNQRSFPSGWCDFQKKPEEIQASIWKKQIQGMVDWDSTGAWRLDLAIFSPQDNPIGVQGIYSETCFRVARSATSVSWLCRKFHGKKIGKEIRGAILTLGFDYLMAEEMHSGAHVDNQASLKISEHWRYSPNGTKNLSTDNKEQFPFYRRILTRRTWETIPDSVKGGYAVQGFNDCKHQFGL